MRQVSGLENGLYITGLTRRMYVYIVWRASPLAAHARVDSISDLRHPVVAAVHTEKADRSTHFTHCFGAMVYHT